MQETQEVPQITSEEINAIVTENCLNMSLTYARFYESNPKSFLTCFLKFKSIRMACSWIVWSYKKSGVFNDCKGDFSDWANKQNLDDRWKPVLSDTLKIIYSIIKT